MLASEGALLLTTMPALNPLSPDIHHALLTLLFLCASPLLQTHAPRRFARLGTASMLASEGGPFIDAGRLDLAKYGARPLLARVLCDYIMYVDHNMRKALELAGEADDGVLRVQGP
jgi:hypothetical protein